MPKYTVTVSETVSQYHYYEVEAASEVEAAEIAETDFQVDRTDRKVGQGAAYDGDVEVLDVSLVV